MNLFAIAGLSVAISCAALSLITLLFGKTKLHRLLLYFNLAVGVWGFGLFLVGIADSGAKAIAAWKIAHLGGVFVGPLFYHLASNFCGKINRKMLFPAYLMALLSSVGIIWTDYIINEIRYVFGLYYNAATPFYLITAMGTYFSPILFAYYKLFRFLERTQGHKRLQTQYIVYGFLFGFVGGGTTFLPMFQIDLFYPFGNFGITLYAFILTYAILRHRLMDIYFIFRRTMVYSLSAALLLGLFVVLMIIGGYVSDGHEHAQLNLFAISGLSVVVSCSILALITLFFGNTKLHRLLLNFNIFIAVWGLGLLFVGISNTEAHAINAWRAACFGGFLIAPCFFHMVRHFCEKRPGILQYFIYLQGAFFSVACIVTDTMINRTTYVFGLNFNVATPLYTTAMLLYSIVVILSYTELFRFLKKARGHKRLQTKYLIFGCIFGFAGAPISMLPMFGINIFYPFGNLGITLYAFIFTYAILRHHLMDLELIFRRTMVYSLSAGLLTGLFLLIIIIMSSYISYFTGHASLWVSSISALIIAVLFTPLKSRIQLLIDKVFYKTSYDYYSIIQKAGSDLVTLIRERDIQDYILKLIFETLKVKSAYFLSRDGGCFKMALSGCSNDNPSTEEMTKKLDSNSELVRLLKARKNIIIKEELAEAVGNDELDHISDELKPFNGTIAVPFFIEDRLNDILVLGEKLSGDIYSDEDMNLLSTISSQAAISLKNAMLYGELEQRVEERTTELLTTNERLRNEIKERRRSERELKRFAYKLEQSNKELEDFTKIVSHDLQEPLWKVKMFGDRLKAGYTEALGEKGRDYMESMYGAVTRMQLLINDLLALSRVTIRAKPNISVDLNRVIGEVMIDLEMRIEQVKGRIKVDDLPVIDADPSQMRQLFQNLIGNALKFHSESRPPVITISSRVTEIDPHKANFGYSAIKLCTIQIEDNGIGFDVSYLDYIFGVFQRLHGRDAYKGTGMGLAICRKIVERHRGNITAESIEGQGATFVVTLPVSQSSIETGE